MRKVKLLVTLLLALLLGGVMAQQNIANSLVVATIFVEDMGAVIIDCPESLGGDDPTCARYFGTAMGARNAIDAIARSFRDVHPVTAWSQHEVAFTRMYVTEDALVMVFGVVQMGHNDTLVVFEASYR